MLKNNNKSQVFHWLVNKTKGERRREEKWSSWQVSPLLDMNASKQELSEERTVQYRQAQLTKAKQASD